MVQGKSKGLQKKAESSRHAAKAAANTKKGRRVIAPKRAAAVKKEALNKVSSLLSTQEVWQDLIVYVWHFVERMNVTHKI